MSQVLILVGSERSGGFNQQLGQLAARLLSSTARVVSFDDLPLLPHLREDHDESGVDLVVDAFREVVRSSDAVLFVTPEYNGGPSSLMKNALDHASRPRGAAPIAGKPTAVIGATPSPGGTQGARDALLRGFAVAGAQPVQTTYGIASAYRYLDQDGYGDEVVREVGEVVADVMAQVESGVSR